MNESTQKAVAVLVELAQDPKNPPSLRVEAAKAVVNRPRYFVQDEEV